MSLLSLLFKEGTPNFNHCLPFLKTLFPSFSLMHINLSVADLTVVTVGYVSGCMGRERHCGIGCSRCPIERKTHFLRNHSAGSSLAEGQGEVVSITELD